MIIYLDNKEMLREDFQKLSVDGKWGYGIVGEELFKPFGKFREILQQISGFNCPSGFALISDNSIIENIYIGQREEAWIDLNINNYTKILIIDNYAGLEGGQWIWKGLTQANIERAFNMKFNNEIIEAIGGFPSTMKLYSPA